MKVELMQLVNTMMEKLQAEADRRADAMLRTTMQMLKNAPATESNKVAPVVETDATSGHRTRTAASRGQQQPMVIDRDELRGHHEASTYCERRHAVELDTVGLRQ